MLVAEEDDMPKQCPECRSVADDDIGYCPGCACKLGNAPAQSRFKQLWQFIAVAAATGSVAAGVAYLWQDRTR